MNVKRYLFHLVMGGMILTAPILKAQSVTLDAVIDSVTMPIGQQTLLHLTLTGPSKATYAFPSFVGDSLVNGVEILERRPVDTLELDPSFVKLRADYLITSFDSGLYYIPPIKVMVDKDPVFSNELAIKIVTYNVDTANYQLFDIKGVQKPPFVLADYLWILLVILLAAVLGLGGWWLYRRYLKRKAHQAEEDVLASLPPHVAAIMALDKLKTDRPWIAGRNKEFYTRLSDILRQYIERRFQVNAPEMTTSDILALFQRDKDTQSVYQNLKQILQLSDLVKFAKLIPLENEHDLSLMNAYLFVNQTKQEEIPDPETQKETLPEASVDGNAAETTSVPPTSTATDDDDELKKYQPK